jgi:hypothetical protein
MIVGQYYDMKIEVEAVSHHRNGVGGEPFYVVRFEDHTKGESRDRKIGVVFDYIPNTYRAAEPGLFPDPPFNPRVAVLSLDRLPDISFGINSWRGDNYADMLYQAIDEWEETDRGY